MEYTKFKLSADSIEISGSQEFVEQQLENFKTLIESSYDKILNKPSSPNLLDQNVNKKKLLLSDHNVSIQESIDADYIEVDHSGEVDHENVYVIDGSTFQLMVDAPGNTVSAQIVAITLIFMYAKLKSGIDTVTFSEIKGACVNHGAFDSKNFARIMDNNKKYFLIMGEAKNKTFKLIRPGIKEAEKLIQQLNKKSNH